MLSFELRKALLSILGALVLTLALSHALRAQPGSKTPPDFKIAFTGDQSLSNDAKAVLRLIKDDSTDVLMIQGDLDYKHDPAAWEKMIDDILGPDFPVFVSAGNHDDKKWYSNDGYSERLQARMNRLGIPWDGDLGVKSSFVYKGIFFVLLAPDIFGKDHDIYLRDKLIEDKSVWSIASWHKNMRDMQVGGKSDDTGWEVYEMAREGGAIIATAHEHSYSRTHLLSNMPEKTIASTSDTLRITEGKTFVFVSGLGGKSIRDQERGGEWWASIYTSDQNARAGALFGVFNRFGIETFAEFYFKNIEGDTIDHFWVVSEVQDAITSDIDALPGPVVDFTLDQNYPNPFNPSTTIHYHLEKAAHVRLTISDMLGRHVRTLLDAQVRAGSSSVQWDGRADSGARVPSGPYFYTLTIGQEQKTRKLLLLK